MAIRAVDAYHLNEQENGLEQSSVRRIEKGPGPRALTERPVALVTGSSSGIGARTAVALSQANYRVFATMRNLSRRGLLDQKSGEAGVAVEVVELDVTDPTSIERGVHEIEAAAGRVDVLVNNAAVCVLGPVEDMPMKDYQRIFDTNFFGMVALTKAVLRGMRERGRGTIINLSAMAGRVGMPALSAYSAAKFAIEGFSEALRYEVAPFGVNVAVVEPGGFKTEGTNPAVVPFVQTSMHESSPYHSLMKCMEFVLRDSWENKMGNPDVAALAIAEVAQAKKPAARYPVGGDSKALLALKRMLPDSAFEFLVKRTLLKDACAPRKA